MNKNDMKKVFKELYQGKRLLAVQLNGFHHTILFDNGETHGKIDIDRFSYYTNMGTDKAKKFFETLKLNHHINFKHDPKEFVFVNPNER